MIMTMNITSRDNKILKHTKKLALHNYRQKSGEFVAEGERLCREALEYVNSDILYAIVTLDFLTNNLDFQKKLDDLGIRIYTVSDDLFKTVSQTTTPQGVLFVIRRRDDHSCELSKSRILILDGISEPGNMGTNISQEYLTIKSP